MTEAIIMVTLISALVGLMVACGRLVLVFLQIVHEVIRIIKTFKDN